MQHTPFHKKGHILDTRSFLTTARNPTNGVLNASIGEAFASTPFGRDSILSSSFLLKTRPDIAYDTILFHAQSQGRKYNSLTEEEPGKIIHEQRLRSHMDTPEALAIFELIWPRWGGTPDELTYYGGVDQSARFVMLINDYCHMNGKTILSEIIVRPMIDARTNQIMMDPLTQKPIMEEVSVLESLVNANNWIMSKLKQSDIGLMEYKRLNPDGIRNQMLRDSATSIYYPDGSLPNFDHPIATIELQGQAYDALFRSSLLIPTNPHAKEWRSASENLWKNTIRYFWGDTYHYPASAIARDEKGNTRKVNTITSQALELLDTTFFDTFSFQQKQKYITPLISMCFSPELLTDVGVRCVSINYLREPGDIAGYHGPQKSWPVLTHIIARGLARQEFSQLANELDARVLNGCALAGNFPEFFDVAPNGQVAYKFTFVETLPADFIGTNGRTGLQTWTAAAVVEAKEQYKKRKKYVLSPTSWQYTLQKYILDHISHIKQITHSEKLRKLREALPIATINIQEGMRREKALLGGKPVQIASV